MAGDFVFIATAGHEIGHGGMELFLKDGAPAPRDTLAWIHSARRMPAMPLRKARAPLARGGALSRPSKSAVALTDEAFARSAAKRLVTEKQAVGELRDVHAAGYANFLGMAGRHQTFHTPQTISPRPGPRSSSRSPAPSSMLCEY